MNATLETIPIRARDVEATIHLFTLRCIGARDAMVDSAGVFSFFYGHGARPVRRVEIRQTARGVYSVDFQHIDPATHKLVIDRSKHDVPAADLRDTIRELT